MVSPKVHDDSQTPYVCFQYAYARNYRIAYAARDEFAGVCADFNEMAGRLKIDSASRPAAWSNHALTARGYLDVSVRSVVFFSA
jgi:hypothetical protein